MSKGKWRLRLNSNRNTARLIPFFIYIYIERNVIGGVILISPNIHRQRYIYQTTHKSQRDIPYWKWCHVLHTKYTWGVRKLPRWSNITEPFLYRIDPTSLRFRFFILPNGKRKLKPRKAKLLTTAVNNIALQRLRYILYSVCLLDRKSKTSKKSWFFFFSSSMITMFSFFFLLTFILTQSQ